MKKVLKVLGTIILMVVSIGTQLANGDSPFEQVGEETNQSEQQEQSEVEKKEEEIEVTSVALGGFGTVSKLDMVVNGISEVWEISSARGMMKYTPDEGGKYAVINITLQNNSKGSQSIKSTNFSLVSKDDTRYVSSLLPMADEKFIWMDTTNPGLEITGNIAFQVPNDLVI